MYVFQRSLMYFPDTRRTPPAQAGLPQAEEVTLTSADGETLVAWHVPPQGQKPLILYFHGNGGSLSLRADRFRKLTADGTGLLALSYRGYGGSSGKPSETRADRRCASRLCLRGGESTGRAHRRVRQVPRHRGGDCDRCGAARRGRHSGCAVHIGGGSCRRDLLVRPRRLAHEGSVLFRPAHRQDQRAATGAARRARQYRAHCIC